MSRTLGLEQLWEMASSTANSRNGLFYHPCCDVWSTRASKAKRASHSKHLQWRQITSTLDKSVEDKKQALLAKMTEGGWRLPALLNEACHFKPKRSFQQETAFKVVNPDLPPEDLRASFAPQDFGNASPDYHFHQALGMFYLYQFTNHVLLLYFNSKPFKPSL